MTEQEEKQFPTLWEAVHDSYMGLLIENTLNGLFSESQKLQFEYTNMWRRLNLLPDLHVEGALFTPIQVWLQTLKSIVQNSPFPTEVSELWKNYQKSAASPSTIAIEKDFPAPNGNPGTAYVDNMRESTFHDRPPTAEEFEKIMSIPGAWALYNRIFDPLFLGVLS